jgi:hypothetical protein
VCSLDELRRQIPEISVTYSTSGFASGSPENGGADIYGCAAKDTGVESVHLYNRVTTGAFYEATGSAVLVPGSIPFPTSPTPPGWVDPIGYVIRYPQVFTPSFSTNINPHIGLNFFCGTETTFNTAGKYLWAYAFICVPIYTSTTNGTQLSSGGQWTHTAKKQYGTRETGASVLDGYDLLISDPGPDWYVTRVPNFPPLDVPFRDGVGNAVFYTGTRPINRPDGSALGITNYVEYNEPVADHRVSGGGPLLKLGYQYVYFQTAPSLVGEFVGSTPTLYGSASTTGNIHSRFFGVSTRQTESVSVGFVPTIAGLPIFSRLPRFARDIVNTISGLSPGQLALIGLSATAESVCVSGATLRRGTNTPYGKNTFEVPGTPHAPGLWSGPTVTVNLSIP